MKYRLFLLCLTLALLLTGCGIVSDNYSSVVPHADSYTQSEEDEMLTVNDGNDLRRAMLSLIDEGTEEKTLTTDVYSGDIEEDFAEVAHYVTGEYPKGAYLVSSIDREIVRVGSYYKINLRIRYRHQVSELQSAREVRKRDNMETVRKEIEAALNTSEETLLLHVLNYEPANFAQMVKEYCENNLTVVMAEPEVQYEIYPKVGSERYVQLRFVYPMVTNELRFRKLAVDHSLASAKESVADEPNDLERARKLYAFLTNDSRSYSEEACLTAAYSLLYDRKADSRAFSAVYEAMCSEATVNCTTVHGTKNGESYDWNILMLESGIWHVDVNDDAQSGAQELRMRTDAEMGEYEWDVSEYPACVGLFEPVKPPKDESAQQEGEQPAETPEGEQQTDPVDTPEPPEDEEPNEPENNP